MASTAKIAANRKNAAKSTGPRSIAGRLRVSRNALRHGLSLPISANAEAATVASDLAGLIAGENPSPARIELARRIADAKIDLDRVREVRIAALPAMPEVQMVLSKEEEQSFWRASEALARNPCDKAAAECFAQSRFLYYDRLEEKRPVPLPDAVFDPARLQRYERRAWARLKAAFREWVEFEGTAKT
jgi:hypothetical protein